MHRIHKLYLAATAVAVVFTATGASQHNVVLIVSDDHGCDLGCYGNRDVRAANPMYAAVLAGLQAELKAFQRKTGDPWIVKDAYE
jgi:hypothetical protein